MSHQVTSEGGGESTGRTLQQSVDTQEKLQPCKARKDGFFFFRIRITLPEPLRATACDIHTWLVPFAKSQSPALQQE